MIKVHCLRCGAELVEPGAILISPPMHERGGGALEKYYKYHFCIEHYLELIGGPTYQRVWIGVSEVAPPARKHCLVLCADGSRVTAWFNNELNHWTLAHPPEGQTVHDVTHYHVFPEAL
jgi:hypothetical protein